MLNEVGKQKSPGLSFGLRDVDEILDGGGRPGDLVMIAGRPGQGKTVFAATMAMAASMGENAKVSTAIFSLEMSKESLLTRMLCSAARVDSQKFRAGLSSR